MTPPESSLRRCFVEKAGRVLSPAFLLEQVWGAACADAVGYISRYMWCLRHETEADPENPALILTERELGYRFCKL